MSTLTSNIPLGSGSNRCLTAASRDDDLSWQSQLALLVSTILGVVLVVLLSPFLLISFLWLGWTTLLNLLKH